MFRLEFDPASGIPPTWVDTKTLNYFNKLRDNIFASSGIYDTVTTDSSKPAGAQQISKSGKMNSSQSNTKNLIAPLDPKDKTSVAFLRGKRSCT
mgnify:FL=1